VARHHRVAAAADGDVKRRAWTPGVGETRREADLLDEPLGRNRRLDGARGVAAPMVVAMLLDVFRQRLA
jgi:hypothetical protein